MYLFYLAFKQSCHRILGQPSYYQQHLAGKGIFMFDTAKKLTPVDHIVPAVEDLQRCQIQLEMLLQHEHFSILRFKQVSMSDCEQSQEEVQPATPSSTTATVAQSQPSYSSSTHKTWKQSSPSQHVVMYAPVPSKPTSAIREPSPNPSQGTSKQSPPPYGPLAAATKITQCLQQHFEDADTHLKVAMYHLSKNEPKEVSKTLEKIRIMNKVKHHQLQFHLNTLKTSSGGLEQKVASLQKREKYLLNTQATMQQKMESFTSIFDDDMDEPACKKRLFEDTDDKEAGDKQ